MIKILYITPFFNYPPRDGASLRSIRLFEKLYETNCIDVFTYNNDSINSKVLEKFTNCNFYFFSSNHEKPKPLTFFNRLFSKKLPGFSSHDPQSIAKDINELISENGGYDIYYFATQLMGQAFIFKKQPGTFVIDLYDVYTTYSQSKKEGISFLRSFYWLFFIEAKRIQKFEIKILNQFDHVLATCKEDYKTIQNLLPKATIHEIPNGVNYPDKVKICKGESLLMVANFDYAGNEEGINWFCDHVWPIIKEKNDNINLNLVGKYPERLKDRIKNEPRISLMGLVSTLDQYYENVACVIIPLFNDGGTKTKLLEAMAYGVSIVSTSIGAKGFSDVSTIKISDEPISFAQSILDVIDQDINKDDLLEGRRLIKDNFTWEKIGDKLNDTLPSLVKN